MAWEDKGDEKLETMLYRETLAPRTEKDATFIRRLNAVTDGMKPPGQERM